MFDREVEISEAQRLILDIGTSIKSEVLPISKALGRICAIDIKTTIPSPPFDRSPFDGYAFLGEDTEGATKENPVTLKINQEIPAGFNPTAEISSGLAAKILTGAPIPNGANAVIKFEDTKFTTEEVTIFESVKPGTNIVRAGEDVPSGTPLLEAGSEITPALIGLLAAQGLEEITVFKKPVISVVNTGTELIAPGNPLPEGKIYNSSMYTLHGFISEMGADFIDGGIVPDDVDAINERILEQQALSDMLITTGGASVGDYDCAVRAAEKAGGEILFWKVKMKPGGSLLAYKLNDKLVLSLSGNPGAAILGLLRIGLPYIRKLCGRSDTLPEECMVHLKNEMKKKSPRTRILRGYLQIEDGKAFFVENEGQGGGDISSLINFNLLGEVPEGSGPLPAGSLIKAYIV